MRSPPFGMDKEVTQVCTGPHYFNYKDEHSITDPFGRPGCYLKAAKPCGMCPWKTDCVNAEGRT